MNAENIRSHINDLLAELNQVTSNGGLLPTSSSNDVQSLRKKIIELQDRLSVLEHLLEFPVQPPVTPVVPEPTTDPIPEIKAEVKSNSMVTNTSGKKKDLKSSIGLNDRFQFVNELFGGSSDELNAALNQLETIDSIETAEDYLDRLSGVYRWDKNGPAYDDFIQLVHRFFGK